MLKVRSKLSEVSSEKLYWLGFSNCNGIGPMKFAALLEYFGSAKVAWNASEEELTTVLKPVLTAKFLTFRQEFSFDRYFERMEKAEVSIITLAEEQYPQLLEQIPNPPFILYVKGNREILKQVQDDKKILGIVGARKVTQYGRDVTEMFTSSLVSSGFTIVSGLAMGVDAVAHQTTVDSGGKTIAVLGCGVDCCTPTENQTLYDQILATGGAVVSEFPLGMMPTMGSFPSRNRIVAGLSQGVLVTEGAEDSGSLITAEYALQFGRKVFAVPGPITSGMSKGPYKLISKGATLVTRPSDITDALGIDQKSIKSGKGTKSIKGDSKDEQKILDLLANEPLTFDELMKKSSYDVQTLSNLVSILELKSIIKTEGSYFRLSST